MTYIPPTTKLYGMTVERASLMGMPHVGCTARGKNKAANCTLCGKPATNAHHVVPKGQGNHVLPLQSPKGLFILESPLIALCGSGTTGCHGKFHDGTYRIMWSWHEDEYAKLWWDGELIASDMSTGRITPHSVSLFEFGIYVLIDNKSKKAVATIDKDGISWL